MRLPTAGDVTAYSQLRCYFTIGQPVALQLLGKCDGIRPRLRIGFPAPTLSRLRPLPLARIAEFLYQTSLFVLREIAGNLVPSRSW